MIAENLGWNFLCQPEMLFIYSPRKTHPISDSLGKFYPQGVKFVKKVKFLHLTNLNYVPRLIPATRKRTMSFLAFAVAGLVLFMKGFTWNSSSLVSVPYKSAPKKMVPADTTLHQLHIH